MTRLAGLLIAGAILLSAEPNLMPWPAKVELGQGSFSIGSPVRIALTGYSEPRLENAIRRLGELAAPGSQATLIVQCEHASQAVQQLGEDESYHLEITPQGARLSAPDPLGVL
jgi:hexosaminidase